MIDDERSELREEFPLDRSYRCRDCRAWITEPRDHRTNCPAQEPYEDEDEGDDP